MIASSGATGSQLTATPPPKPLMPHALWALIPDESGVLDAVEPMTAIEPRLSGRMFRSFLSSTDPCSAIACAVALCWAVDTSAAASAGSGWSKSPAAM